MITFILNPFSYWAIQRMNEMLVSILTRMETPGNPTVQMWTPLPLRIQKPRKLFRVKQLWVCGVLGQAATVKTKRYKSLLTDLICRTGLVHLSYPDTTKYLICTQDLHSRPEQVQIPWQSRIKNRNSSLPWSCFVELLPLLDSESFCFLSTN